MRPPLVKTAVALFVGAAMSLPIVHASPWTGSYSAAGECYCSGELPSHVRLTIVPTPVGGQTVGQVCERIGRGPGLERVNGLFNHPVYVDAQCGNGPGIPMDKRGDKSCSGSFDGIGADIASCFPIGPHWNLESVYSARPETAAAMPSPSGNQESGESDAAEVDTPIRSVSADTVGEDTESRGPEDATLGFSDLPEGAQAVVIGRQRYLRARDGYPAAGGKPGQRILLDGVVYLRDDNDIDLQDVFRQPVPESRSARIAREQDIGDQPTKSIAGAGESAGQVIDADEPGTLTKDEHTERARQRAETRRTEIRRKAARRQEQRRQEALQIQADARATSRQIEAQRRQLQDQTEAATVRQQVDAANELRQARQQLEIESAQRARKVPEAHDEKRRNRDSVETESQLETADVDLPVSAPDSVKEREEPALSAASPATDEMSTEASETEHAVESLPVSPEVPAVEEVSRQVATPGSSQENRHGTETADAGTSSLTNALRLPAAIRPSARNFRYLEALPVNYDVGGNGVMLEGSASSHSRLQYFGRLGITNRYRELLAGGGYYLTPESASRLTLILLAGIEYGTFELIDDASPEIQVDYDDSGVYLAATSRMVVNNRFELKGGVSYSSLFEGDATVFGGGYLHLNRKLDLVTRFELGDNDLLGIGIRYYY